MKLKRFQRHPAGKRIGDDLTLVQPIANARGRHPIYLAWSHSAWAPVAAKSYRTLADAEREYNVLKAAAHPNVVQAFGVYAPNLMLMEFLEGETLRGAQRRRPDGRFGIADSLRLAIPIGAALAATHKAGYAHLDIKPENVMIVDGRPVLFDFGTVRRLDARPPSKEQGSKAYLSPEMRALQQVGAAADVFSLGVLLFELLTGELPFGYRGRDPLIGQVRDFRPAVSKELDRIVAACLAREPSARPELAWLLPALNAQIRTGPKMWPDDLRLQKSRGRVPERASLPAIAA